MILTLKREKPDAPNSTRSTMYADGRRVCVMLELGAAPQFPGGPHRIAAGAYRVRTTYSNRFSRLRGKPTYLPQLFNRPGGEITFGGRDIDETGVRFHTGNVVNGKQPGTKGGPRLGKYDPTDPNRTDSDGCPLAGVSWAPGPALVNSVGGFAALNKLILAAEARGEVIDLLVS